MENKEQQQSSAEFENQVAQSIRHMLAEEYFEDLIAGMLDEAENFSSEAAFEEFEYGIQNLRDATTLDQVFEEMQNMGHDPINAAFYVVDAIVKDPTIRSQLRHILGLVPEKGWDA